MTTIDLIIPKKHTASSNGNGNAPLKELARNPKDFHEKSKAQLANFTKERGDVKIMLSKYYTDNLNTKINLLDIVQIQPKPSVCRWLA